MTPDADDASPSPEYSGDLETIDMAEQKEQKQQQQQQQQPQPQQPTSSDASPTQGSSNGEKKSANAKDPLRPRRKKARRACYACQRAHLTCGDERPCQRCIKRGLQDTCHDGVRKKAKYLHDAPNEALMPVNASHYQHLNSSPISSLPGTTAATMAAVSLAQSTGFLPQTQLGDFDIYSQNISPGQMPAPMQHNPSLNSFSSQHSPISPGFTTHASHQTPPLQDITSPLPQTSQANIAQMHQFGRPLFDPSDPAFFNFDISSLNFGNQYGASEFQMLNHMSLGAAETPPESGMNTLNHMQNAFSTPMNNSSPYIESPTQNLIYGQDTLIGADWQNSQSRQGSAGQVIHAPHTATINVTTSDGSNGLPHAYAIGNGPSSLASTSPASTGQDILSGYDNSPISPAFFLNTNQQPVQQQQQPIYNRQHRTQQPQQQTQQPQPLKSNIPLSALQSQTANPRKRPRDTSTVYESVKEPYPYTSGFHSLTAFLQSRFSPQKKMRIAKALASIRPSFISCTGTLNRDDLVFMEKCFQRTLWEYQDFINAYGTPTIICRRTGEVAAVSKEFSILTGWRKDVLLGKEPNLNANTGGTSGHQTGSSSRAQTGVNTPRTAGVEGDGPARPHSVFLAELLDDDSVIQFYEDFAKLAFGDSRGSVIKPCKLLKYKTKEEMAKLEDLGGASNGKPPTTTTASRNGHHRSSTAAAKLENAIAGEAEMNALSDREGKVDCMYCWTVKRDVFEVPMLIVMNFLPCI